MDERTGTSSPGEGSYPEERRSESSDRVQDIAGDRIRKTLESRKSYLASELDGVASLFEDVGRTLEGRGRGEQKKVADYAAGFTRKASRTLRENSTDELISFVRRQVRERPEAAFAGALALGFLGARFLK